MPVTGGAAHRGRLRLVGLGAAAVLTAAGAAALVRAGDPAGPPAAAPATTPACATEPVAAGGHRHRHTYPHLPAERGGLAATGDGLRLDVDRTELAAGTEAAVELRLTRTGGTTARVVRSGDVPMHVYLVRDDLGSYQHVHPTATPDCGWRVRVRPPTPGRYRLYAEFRPEGSADDAPDVVLSRPVTVPGPPVTAALPAATPTARTGPYVVSLGGYAAAGGESLLTFTVSRDGRPVRTLSPYLGAMAHVSVFRAGSLAFNHAHPLEPPGDRGGPRLTTPLLFPGAGTYRVFVQFVADGEERMAALTVPVR